MPHRERLALVGGGHAHVEVLRQLAEEPSAALDVTVVSDRASAIYSGMVPGLIAGQYELRDVEVDVARLCDRAGARFVLARATGVDVDAHRVPLEDGRAIEYDRASLDVGSTVAGLDTPGVREHALASRPISRLVEQGRALAPTGPIVVVGGGAAGVELAFCLRERLRDASGRPPATSLVEAGPSILAQAAPRLRQRVERAASARGIERHVGARVEAVEKDHVALAGGRRLESALTVWVTGAAPHPFLAGVALPRDDAGFVRIQSTLQVVGRAELFAVGDCASLPGTLKAGVYAVRQGPVLAANLRAHLEGRPLRRYTPQRDFLQLLNLGDGTAIASKWGFAVEGRIAHRLKDRIDRGWIARYV